MMGLALATWLLIFEPEVDQYVRCRSLGEVCVFCPAPTADLWRINAAPSPRCLWPRYRRACGDRYLVRDGCGDPRAPQ